MDVEIDILDGDEAGRNPAQAAGSESTDPRHRACVRRIRRHGAGAHLATSGQPDFRSAIDEGLVARDGRESL